MTVLPERDPSGACSAATIAEAEARLGVGLPRSYRRFVGEVGPGTLAQVALWAPGAVEAFDLVTQGAKVQTAFADSQVVRDGRVRRARGTWVPFAVSADGDRFAMRVLAKRAPIHVLVHEDEAPHAYEVAADFDEFVEQVVLGQRLVELGLAGVHAPVPSWRPAKRQSKAAKGRGTASKAHGKTPKRARKGGGPPDSDDPKVLVRWVRAKRPPKPQVVAAAIAATAAVTSGRLPADPVVEAVEAALAGPIGALSEVEIEARIVAADPLLERLGARAETIPTATRLETRLWALRALWFSRWRLRSHVDDAMERATQMALRAEPTARAQIAAALRRALT